MRRFAVTPAINIGFHDVAQVINIVTIKAGAMIFVFPDDLKPTYRSPVSFASTGYARRRGPMPCALEIGFLGPQAHYDRRTTRMTSGRFDVTMSVTVLQPLTIMRPAHSAENCESRFMHFVSTVIE